jgi:putative CocE/NonD family hydrolase
MLSLASDTARRAGKVQTMLKLLEESDRIAPHYDHLPLKTLPILRESALASYYFDWLDHATYDPYWQATAIKERYSRVKVPALNMGGWHDLFLMGTLENYIRMQKEGGSREARDGQRLLIGPWSHGAFTGLFPEHNYGIMSGQDVIDITAIQLRFFDYHLKGIKNGLDAEPPVRIFIMGENKWRDENEWPLARTQYTPWYFHGNGRAGSDGGTLSLVKPGDEPQDVYLYDPHDPTPTIGGPTLMHGLLIGLNAGPRDQRAAEARPDVLVYTSDVLDKPLEVTGPLKVTLYAASSAPDTDFIARLCDVFPDGASRLLAEGIIRACYRQGTDRARPITPGEVYEYTIDLVATSNVFLPGHRLRLDIMSSSFPRFDRNLNNGKLLGEDTLADAQSAQQAIFHDSSRPSHILLPVIPQV